MSHLVFLLSFPTRRSSDLEDSEPEPDVAVVPGRPDAYSRAHPSRPVLTVEVSESSLAVDRQRKGSLYARAGLADYWVLNLVDRVLEVYREPVPDPAGPFGWRYASREVFDASAWVTPLAVPARASPSHVSFPDRHDASGATRP